RGRDRGQEHGYATRASERVVEDHAQRVAPARSDPGHTAAEVRAVIAAAPAHGTLACREDDELSPPRQERLGPRLGARPLLAEKERAARVVDVRLAQEARDLEGEGHRAVEVLVQAVVATRLVVEKQRRRLRLAVAGARLQERAERRGEARGGAERLHPAVRDRRQPRVEGLAQLADERRERGREVLVVAFPEAVASHLDA